MDWVSRNTRRGVGPDAASIGHGVVGFISATRVDLDPGEISRGKEAIDAAAVAASLELGAYLVELSPRHRDEPWTPAVRDLVHMARTGRLRGIVLDQVEALAADRDDALLVAVALVECGVRIVEARPRRPGVASRARPSARRRSSRTLAGGGVVIAADDGHALVDDLVATGRFRVLRRLDLPDGACCTGGDAETLVGLAIDLETTGLDASRHSIIECSMRRFRFDACGTITRIDRAYAWLEDPGEPLDPTITALTGLTDADLQGQRIDDRTVAALARSAHVVCAFNTAFDRPFFERRFPQCAGMAWACAMKEVDWRSRGFDGSGRSLGWLLAQCGLFHGGEGAHRAQSDVDALIAILRHVDSNGRTACAEMTETAVRPGCRFRATGAHFDVKAKLKARGYAWDGKETVWVREVPDHARDAEAAWLAAEVYAPCHRPKLAAPAVEEVTWFTRYA